METMDWNPGNLLQTSGNYWHACVLHTGVKLAVFSCIGSNALTASQVAKAINTDLDSTQRLLNALCAMALLKKSADSTYRTTDVSMRYLSKDSVEYLGHIILHHHYLMHSWNNLDQAVMNGKPVRGRATQSESSHRESFLMGMFNLGMLSAPKMIDYLDFTHHRRLLDLGGGPGAFAIHFCRQYPHLSAVVFDLPGTGKFAADTIEKSGMNDRVDFVAGDFLKDDFPKPFDVAWLSHILHAEGPETCHKILSKTVAAMDEGGEIIIHEFILNDSMDGPLFPALFSLNMLLGTEQGQAYSQSQLIQMMADVGVTDIRRTGFVGPSESGILIGKVP